MTAGEGSALLSNPGAARRILLIRLSRVVVAAAVLGYLFVQVPFAAVLEGVTAAAAVPLVGAFLISLAGQLIVADRLRRLTGALGMAHSTARLFAINLAARFYGLFLPAGNVTGIAIRYYSLARQEKNYVGIGLALVLDRVFATITLGGVGVGFWFLAIPVDSWPALVALTGAFGVLCLPLLAVAPPRRLVDAVRRAPVPRAGRLTELRDHMRRLRTMPRATFVLVVLAGAIVHLLGGFAYALIALSLAIDIAYVDLVWIRSTALLVAILPISVAGLGVREAALVMLLTHMSVAAADALAFSLLVFTVTVLAIGLIGGAIEAHRFHIASGADRRRQPRSSDARR